MQYNYKDSNQILGGTYAENGNYYGFLSIENKLPVLTLECYVSNIDRSHSTVFRNPSLEEFECFIRGSKTSVKIICGKVVVDLITQCSWEKTILLKERKRVEQLISNLKQDFDKSILTDYITLVVSSLLGNMTDSDCISFVYSLLNGVKKNSVSNDDFLNKITQDKDKYKDTSTSYLV